MHTQLGKLETLPNFGDETSSEMITENPEA